MSASASLELEKLMVRLVADSTVYDKVLADAERRLMSFVKRVEASSRKIATSLAAPATAMGRSIAIQTAHAEAGAKRMAASVTAAAPAFTAVQNAAAATGVAMARAAAASQQQFVKAFATIETVGRSAMLAITAPLAVVGGLGLKQFAEFERGLVRTAAAGNLTERQLQAMQRAALSTSEELGLSAGKIVQTYSSLVRAGLDLTQVLEGAGKSAAMLAEVGQIPGDVASNTIAKILNVFRKDSLSAAQAVDTLSAAADASTINIRDFIFTLNQGAGMAAAAGQSFRDFATVTAMLGPEGSVGADAGTSLKRFFQMLTNDESAAKLRKFGIEAIDAAGNIKPLRDIIDDLNRVFADMPTGKRNNALSDIFGSDAVRAANALTSQGAAGFDDIATKMTTALTVAQKWDRELHTLSGRWGAFMGSLERFGIVVGSHLVGPLQTATSFVEYFTKAFEKTHPVLQTVAVLGGLAAASIPPLLWSVGKIGGMLGAGGSIALGAKTVAPLLKAMFSGARNAVHLFATSIINLIPSVVKLNGVILANDFRVMIGGLTNITAAVNTQRLAWLTLTGVVGLFVLAINKDLRDSLSDPIFKTLGLPTSADEKKDDIALSANMKEFGARLATHQDNMSWLQRVRDNWLNNPGMPGPATAAATSPASAAARAAASTVAPFDAMSTFAERYWEQAGATLAVRLERDLARAGDQLRDDLQARGKDAQFRQEEADQRRFGAELSTDDMKYWEHMTDSIVARLDRGMAADAEAFRAMADAQEFAAAATVQTATRLPDALVVGTQEAANAMLRAISATPPTGGPKGGDGDIQKMQFEAQKKANQSLEKIEKNLRSTTKWEFADI